MASDPLKLVGERLKAARQAQGLSSRDLAIAGDIALNTISLIERGKISPTVATLHKLATALHIPLTFFFEDSIAQEVVFIRKEQRQRFQSARLQLESLGSGLNGQTMEPLLVTLEPEADSGATPIVHVGHELVFCLEGRIEYQVGDETYHLEQGDSLLFEAHLAHCWRNPLPSVTKVLLIIQAAQGSEDAMRKHLKE